jgi:hypothetical protein
MCVSRQDAAFKSEFNWIEKLVVDTEVVEMPARHQHRLKGGLVVCSPSRGPQVTCTVIFIMAVSVESPAG